MSKRNSKDLKHNYHSPLKKQKLHITIENTSKANNGQSTSKKQDDVWGDDFPEADLENIDLLASQAFSQKVNTSNESIEAVEKTSTNTVTKNTNTWSVPSFNVKTHVSNQKTNPVVIYPDSLSNSSRKSSTNTFKPKTKESKGSVLETNQFHDAKSNQDPKNTIPPNKTAAPFSQKTEAAFGEFKTKLLNENNMNSTFLSQNAIVRVPDDLELDQLTKLTQAKMKLEGDIMTKEGEIIYLRGQLKAAQQKLSNDTFAVNNRLKEQEIAHKAQLKAMKKENDNVTTQLSLQNYEISNLHDKIKKLENKTVKFIQPQSPTINSGKRSSTLNSYKKIPSVNKTYKETATQMELADGAKYKSEGVVILYPLQRLHESIFEESEPEKPIIDIHVTEKIGGDLHILQETDNLRVSEKTEVVKPIVTFVDNKELNVQFFLSNLSRMLHKSIEEINSSESLPIINMITSTARELVLNATTSLKKIFNVMTIDDIRDMNEFYLSKCSTIKISDIDNIFSAKELFDKERAIEARRSLAVLSRIAEYSIYLGEYISGKKPLKVNEDSSYKRYIEQFKTYNSWSNKGCDFEFLEMILQFVKIVGLTRRAHQFCGVINAIILILNNTQRNVGFCSTGVDYVYKIFREIVFSRPLVENIPAVCEMLMTFANFQEFSDKLCFSLDRSVVSSNNEIWYFEPGPNTCIMEILISQINKLINDPVVLLNTMCGIVSFIEKILPSNSIPWKHSQRNSCKCYSLLISFAVKSIYKCMDINIDNLEAKFEDATNSSNISMTPVNDVWLKLKRRQKAIAIKGIDFFCYLMNSEYYYIVKRADMHSTLYLFIDLVEKMFDLEYSESFKIAKERSNNYIEGTSVKKPQGVPANADTVGTTRKFGKSGNKSEWKRNDKSRLKCLCSHKSIAK